MSGSNMGDWFGGSAGGSTRGSGQSWPMTGLWEAMEQLRGQFEQKVGGGTRMGRGDVRAAVLALLAEKPMHGYQIIQRDRGAQRRQLEAERRLGLSDAPAAGRRGADQRRGGGRTQDLLAHRGRARRGGGRRRASPRRGRRSSTRESSGRASALPKAGIELAQAAAQVGRIGHARSR